MILCCIAINKCIHILRRLSTITGLDWTGLLDSSAQKSRAYHYTDTV